MALIKNNVFWREFIRIYKEHSELWKLNDKKYKNKKLKINSWEILVKKLKEIEPDANVECVKKRIHAMRSSFWRELRKVKKSEISDSNKGDIYIPSLWYYNELIFLKEQEEQTYTVYKDNFSDVDVAQTQRKKRILVEKYDELANEEQNMASTSKQIYLKEEDEVDIYGKYWITNFRKLSSQQQIYAKRAIEEIIYLGQLGKLNQDSYRNNSNYSSTSSELTKHQSSPKATILSPALTQPKINHQALNSTTEPNNMTERCVMDIKPESYTEFC